MTKVALLGDSIFDNAAYVGAGGRDVVTHLGALLPDDWSAELLARDGDRVDNVATQLRRASSDATHLVASAGGNDALDCLGVFDEPAATVGAALLRLGGIQVGFQSRYAAMLKALLATNRPVAACTVYYPRFPDAQIQAAAVAALAIFNDAIVVECCRAGVAVIDLRLICDQAADYANPIEPSDAGGRKIARAVAGTLGASGGGDDVTRTALVRL